jgi:hypothetical protein
MLVEQANGHDRLTASVRYKCWRSHKDNRLHLICHEGEFDGLPDPIRHLGPWTGSREGEVERLRPHYRANAGRAGLRGRLPARLGVRAGGKPMSRAYDKVAMIRSGRAWSRSN